MLTQGLESFFEAAPESLLTGDPETREIFGMLIDQSRERLREYGLQKEELDEPQQPLNSESVAHILGPIRAWFDFPYYFLLINGWVSSELLANSSMYTFWMQCSQSPAQSQRDLLDPFPAIRKVALLGAQEQATLCWNTAGETVLIPGPAHDMEDLVSISRRIPPWELWDELKRRQKQSESKQSFHILQLSDLHFGLHSSESRLTYVEQHLRGKVKQTLDQGGVVQPVVTGDLMDTPSKANLSKFDAFRNRLASMSNTNVIVIPGNHDIRRKGIFRQNWQVVAGLEWSSVVESDVSKTLFICFDTSKDAELARGRITDEQFLEVATKLNEVLMRHREDQIRIVLVHHHPFSTREDEIDVIPFLRIHEERFLRMENSEHLIQWCAKNEIPLILHGHKHKPRYIAQEVEHQGEMRAVRSIGCGTTLGAEGKPLSYNWITWNPDNRNWSVSYFADPGDGSGFAEKRLIVGGR